MGWIILALACAGKVDSDKAAELAYIGLDAAVEKALGLGLDGYNAASSANIDAQSTVGDASGTLTVSGQVDQGSSDNKELRLDLLLEDYADLPDDDEDGVADDDDDPDWVYDTDADALPALDLSLRDIPDGTLEGTLVGTFIMEGQLEGEVALDLAIAGDIEADGADGVRRADGTTSITGTATSAYGAFEIDVTR